MLSDSSILEAMKLGDLSIEPFDADHLQGASYDLTLGDQVLVMQPGHCLDPRKDTVAEFRPRRVAADGIQVMPGVFVLATTAETVRLGNGLVARVEGKSSLGRLGLVVHSTAGFIDPGFAGQITLEMSCAHARGVKIFAGMPIGQLAVMPTSSEVARPYNGKYQMQKGPVASRYHENWIPHAVGRGGSWR